MKSSCCITWLALSEELAEAKAAELQKLVEQGLPRSMFATLADVLLNMSNYCPVCGQQLLQIPAVDTAPRPNAETRPVTAKSVTPPPPPSPALPKAKCGACHGEGSRGCDENGIENLCGQCLGKGVMDATNKAKFDVAVDRLMRAEDEKDRLAKENRPIDERHKADEERIRKETERK